MGTIDRVALDELDNGHSVSTVLISDDDGSRFYETMVFNERNDGIECKRTHSHVEALVNHLMFAREYRGER